MKNNSDSEMDSDSIDEELEEGLPICAQGTLAKLRRSNRKLRNDKKFLLAKLQNCANCQRLQAELNTLQQKLKTQLVNESINADNTQDNSWNINSKSKNNEEPDVKSISEQVREVAESALTEQGMIYEPTSGLYYHAQSGYYFDAERSLYYDGNSGTWFRYDTEKAQYEVYSTAPEEEIAAHRELKRRKDEEMRQKKRLKKEMKRYALTKDNIDDTVSNSDGSDVSDSDKSNSVDEVNSLTLPCARVIVLESSDRKVRPGSLFIITVQGGTIGSQGIHDVLLPDEGCSKNHGKFTFDHATLKFYLRDLGSRNGTRVNGKRISKSKVESENVEIGHGSVLEIGNTKLICHVHPGHETCLQCEPGVVGEPSIDEKAAEEEKKRLEMKEVLRKQKNRRSEIKMMKRKYGLQGDIGGVNEESRGTKYEDRAKIRRRVQGSDCPGEKTEQASLDKAIDVNNKGHKMLEKMGWKGGGLGATGEGRDEPVKVEMRVQGAGLGSSVPLISPSVNGGACQKQKTDIWMKTQKRFSDAPLLAAFNNDDDSDDESNPVVK